VRFLVTGRSQAWERILAEDTWYRVALPVLEFVDNHHGPPFVSIGDLAEGTGLDPGEVLLRWTPSVMRATSPVNPQDDDRRRSSTVVPRTLGVGRARTPGRWRLAERRSPRGPARLARSTDRSTTDPKKRSKLQSLKSSGAEVGTATIAGLLVELATRHDQLLGPEDERGDPLCRIGLHARHDVRVGLPRCRRGSVTGALRDDRHVQMTSSWSAVARAPWAIAPRLELPSRFEAW
jgi:hypothetical protein